MYQGVHSRLYYKTLLNESMDVLVNVGSIVLDEVHQHLQEVQLPVCCYDLSNPLQHERTDLLLQVLYVASTLYQRYQ